MIVGFLHIGAPKHGVCRYGRLLAAEAKQRNDLTVLEQAVILPQTLKPDAALLRTAADQLTAADVVHIQFTETIWGPDAHRFRNLRTFLRRCRPPVVVTIHDTEPISYCPEIEPAKGFKTVAGLRHMFRLGRLALHFAGIIPTYLTAHHEIRHWLMERTSYSFVCTAEEERRLHAPHLREKIKRIPHFVEDRPSLPARDEARAALDIDQQLVITLLGFIYGGKGYEILLDAVAALARSDVLVVFAGGEIPGNESYLRYLQERARVLGISKQLRVTGYLSEDELNRYLIATDIPVCPYEKCYASSSLSSWISANRIVLASRLPQFEEYEAIEPGALHLFSPYTPDALTESIRKMIHMLQKTPYSCNQKVMSLQYHLSMQHIFEKHRVYYQQIAR